MSFNEETLEYRTCNHVKEDGTFCGSPALDGRDYCYYHLTQRGRRMHRAQARRRGQPWRLQLPLLDNLRAVQIAIGEVLEAMAGGQLDTRAAGVMLYGIQQATVVLKAVDSVVEWQDEDDEIPRVGAFPGFEQQYGIPPGIDLEADPEVALQQAEDDPEALQSQPASSPPQPQVTTVRKRVRPRDEDDNDDTNSPTYADVKAQLQHLQSVASKEKEKKKSAASVAATELESANSA
jgi:hypothetical protein